VNAADAVFDAELVIFDCDGVLVDTEPLTNRLLAACVSEAGWAISTSDSIRMFKGHDLNEIVLEVERRVGRPLPDLLPTYRARMFEAFAREAIAPIEGAIELLDALDRSHASAARPRRCVASNGPMNKMHASLTSAGLIGRFHHAGEPRLYSAYEVGLWKPDPALFLHAARDMASAPASCIVIEDSTSGVVAARRAGMPVVALAGLTPAASLVEAGATLVIEHLRELLPTK
jgi:beta-phosphoglucomutase-like phosphatase (HAD superfamily)